MSEQTRPQGDRQVPDRLMRTARAVRDRLPTPRSDRLEAELTALRARVRDLEEEVEEGRRHHLRVAELTDVVQALLVPLATADRDGLDDVLRRYSEQLG